MPAYDFLYITRGILVEFFVVVTEDDNCNVNRAENRKFMSLLE
jgi:hypothetical protein